MKKIFAGLIFILFNVNVTLGGYMIGLLPAFLGYLLVAAGLKEVWQEEGIFENLVPLALEIAVFTGVIYLIQLLPMTRRAGLLAVLNVLAALCFFAMAYKITDGIKALEKKHLCTLSARRLVPLAGAYTVCKIAAQLLAMMNNGLEIAVTVVTLAVAFIFIITFYDTTNKYRYLQHI